jgi:hypothetical protein
MWCDQLRRVSQFCGVEVLTYAVLDNHFHVLVHVPMPRRLADGELVDRYRALYPHRSVLVQELEDTLREGGAQAEDLRRRLHARMHDVSQFLKELKQRFTVWFNSRHGLYGTIWDGRFKSILVEDDTSVLRTVAAYIDLNPLRAGLVERPEAFRWCGLAAAERGDPLARAGLAMVMKTKRWKETRVGYQHFVYQAGIRQVKARPHATIDVDDVEAAITEPSLMTRQRWFSESWVVGSTTFVRQHLQAFHVRHRDAFPVQPRLKEGKIWGGAIAMTGRGRSNCPGSVNSA